MLLCKETNTIDCLTQPQVDSLKTFYGGTSTFPGYSMGDEESWAIWVLGGGPGRAPASNMYKTTSATWYRAIQNGIS